MLWKPDPQHLCYVAKFIFMGKDYSIEWAEACCACAEVLVRRSMVTCLEWYVWFVDINMNIKIIHSFKSCFMILVLFGLIVQSSKMIFRSICRWQPTSFNLHVMLWMGLQVWYECYTHMFTCILADKSGKKISIAQLKFKNFIKVNNKSWFRIKNDIVTLAHE